MMFLGRALLATLIWQTGFDQTGGFRLTGPNGITAVGAYHFEDLCTPNPREGLISCYQLKLVLDHEIGGLLNIAPDIIMNDHVHVWGDQSGHFWWQCGDWTIEMIAIDEAIRQQVSWEAEQRRWQHIDSGIQHVNITI